MRTSELAKQRRTKRKIRVVRGPKQPPLLLTHGQLAGPLKADPAKLLARYFDVHVYFANWGSPQLYSFQKRVGVISARVEMLRSSAISLAVNRRSSATNS